MSQNRVTLIAWLLAAVQVIGGGWSFGASVCLASDSECEATAVSIPLDGDCCCGHEEDESSEEPEDGERCDQECGCCVKIPAPDRDTVEPAVQAASVDHKDHLAPSPPVLAWTGLLSEAKSFVHPPPERCCHPPPDDLSTIRLQV